MIVFWRKPGQAIEVSGPARITVLSRDGVKHSDRKGRNWVRLGIEAERHIKILRSELVDQPLPAEAACDVGDDA